MLKIAKEKKDISRKEENLDNFCKSFHRFDKIRKSLKVKNPIVYSTLYFETQGHFKRQK